MAAALVEGDAVGIVLGLDALFDLEGLEIEDRRLPRLPVVGVSLAGAGDDADAMGAAGYAFDIADQLAAVSIQHGDAVAVRHIQTMRRLVINQIVPAVGRPERDLVGDFIGWGLRL